MNTNESRRTDRIREKKQHTTFEMHKTTRKQTTLKTPNENGKLVDNFFPSFSLFSVLVVYIHLRFLMEYTQQKERKKNTRGKHTKTNQQSTQLGINVSSFGQRLFFNRRLSHSLLQPFSNCCFNFSAIFSQFPLNLLTCFFFSYSCSLAVVSLVRLVRLLYAVVLVSIFCLSHVLFVCNL